MDQHEFQQRTKAFALDALRLAGGLTRSQVTDVIGRQLIRSATSVGANYRAACRARSRAEMLAKLSIVEEEADESLYWMELLVESGSAQREVVRPIQQECTEILAMVVKSKKTLRDRIALDGRNTNRQSTIGNRQ